MNQKQQSPGSWETLVYELFENVFSQVVPGSIAVFLYVQPWADQVMQRSSFMSALMFLILAWVVGTTLSVMSFYPLILLVDIWEGLKAKEPWREIFFIYLHDLRRNLLDLRRVVKQIELDGDIKIRVQLRMHFSVGIMFRSIAALSAISFVIWWLIPPLQPQD